MGLAVMISHFQLYKRLGYIQMVLNQFLSELVECIPRLDRWVTVICTIIKELRGTRKLQNSLSHTFQQSVICYWNISLMNPISFSFCYFLRKMNVDFIVIYMERGRERERDAFVLY